MTQAYYSASESFFFHKISKLCEYGIECERQLFMFSHNAIYDITLKNAVTADQSEILDVDGVDETNDPCDTFY